MANTPYTYSDLPRVFNTHNRLMYDKCAYAHRLVEATSPLQYQIFPPAYESCRRCYMPYPGFYGANMGGTEGSNPVRGADVDLESDLRDQTRIATLCPRHKYIPQCKGTCQKARMSGYPCSGECQSWNTNNPPECPSRESIIPVESVDSRQFKPCNDLSGIHINRFEPGLLEDPQHPSRIFKYNSKFRLGMDTNQMERDMHKINYHQRCLNYRQPNPAPCKAGSSGCQQWADFETGVFF